MRRALGVSVWLALACGGGEVAGPDVPAGPARLAFSTQPADVRMGDTLAPVRVAIHDADGNLVTTATDRVTLTLTDGGTGAALAGTRAVAAVDGIATFDDLSVAQPGEAYTLTASAQGLTAATSSLFDILSLLLDIEQREVAFQAVEDLMAGLPGDDLDADKEAIVAFLEARGEFAQAGISENGTVWALFTDGVPYFITDNLAAAATPGAPRTPPGLRGAHPHRSHAAAVTGVRAGRGAAASAQQGPSGLPAANTYRMLNGFGDFFDDTDPSEEIREMLEQAGYVDAGGSSTATVEALRNVTGTGVLYFRSHGGDAILIDLGGTRVDGLWTATPRTIPEPPDIFDDLLAGRLGYATELNNLKYGFFGERATHYMITAEFIRHYWGGFPDNAFVYFDGCWGATMASIRTALTGKNVSVFASWTNVSRVGSNQRTAQYVFDRLLGTNVYEPEDPYQRPFDYDVISSQFGGAVAYGHDQFPSSDPTKPDIVTDLEFFQLGGEFGLLAPSVRTVQVDEATNELTLSGIFGPDPGAGDRAVTVEGTELTVQRWDTHEIVVSDVDPEAAGYVVVAVGDIESNPAPLTRWEGQFTYTVDLSDLWAPSLTQVVVCDLHFRADVRGYRDVPGPVLIEPADTLYPTQSSTCEFSMFGSGSDGVNDMTLSGGGPMALAGDESPPPDYFTARGTIDVMTHAMTMSLTMGATGEITVTPPGGASITVPSPLTPDLETLWGDAACPPAVPPVGFPLALVDIQGWSMTSASRSGDGPCALSDMPNTLEWTALTATFTPQASDGR